MTVLTGILTSKFLWSIIGPVIAVIVIYLAGKRDQKRTAENASLKAREELRRQILEVEKKNQEREKERDEKVDEIRGTKRSNLIRLWNKDGWGPKDKS